MPVAFDIETTGLDPSDCKVILIGLKVGRKIRQWKVWELKDEAKMILDALEVIWGINDTIIGYNNLKFDVPFLLERLKILEKYEPRLFKIYNKKWFDLYQYLGNDFRSLKYWLNKAGIKRKHPELDGRDMPIYFENKEYDKIIKHNRDDLTTSEKLFRYLKKLNPELLPF
ncbi:MAG: ribonuclease H-like domain-containing protein [Thermoproteota archaeon]